jgi:hypothetical protein
MSAKTKTFTQKQIDRLPDEGYWLQYPSAGKRPSAVCIMNGQLKYIHNEWGKDWCTLMWTCCYTKKEIANPEFPSTIYEHYKTHLDMITAHPELDNAFQNKAPNDN